MDIAKKGGFRNCLTRKHCLIFIVTALMLTGGCVNSTEPGITPVPLGEWTREEAIPANAVKMTLETDVFPLILNSDEFEKPVPLGQTINTSGGEDSAFVTPDGNTLYFFFTPDVSIPAEQQLFDGVTGIWVSQKQSGEWCTAQRVVLENEDELALDGCVFVQGDEMWFCSARAGNYRGVDMWTAQYREGRWSDWKNAGSKLNVDYEVGELHVTADGNEMYFHSSRAGGSGGYDIWVTRLVNGEWQEPENIEAVNTPDTEGWPFVTQDGKELWFTRFYMGSPAIFRSYKVGGEWGEPELIISQFAGEPSLDNQGNLYFTHHYFKGGKMIEADIYVAYRK
jgi:ribosomal protein L24E